MLYRITKSGLGTLVLRASAALASLFLCGAPAAQAAVSNPPSIFQYAIYYNSLLEFTWCPPMTVNGTVYCSTNIYTGSAWSLIFNSYVEAGGTLSSPPWDGHATTDYSFAAKYNAAYVTNAPALALPIGAANTSGACREIINLPPPGGDTNQFLAAQRYYNKAGLVLLVSNSVITAIIKNSMDDPAPAVINANYYPTNTSWTNYSAITNNFPFLSLTNFWPSNSIPASALMTDQRENAKVLLTDVDMGKLIRWLFTNPAVNAKFPNTNGIYASATAAPNILYVADNRSYTNGWLTAVRLRNAQWIPTNMFIFNGTNTPSGFTVATPNPLYIYGNYNCPNSAYFGSTNTAAAGAYPAALICDALTVLSRNWQDSQSALTLGAAGKSVVTSATDVTLNAAIIAGVVYSTGSGNTQFSGGVQNLPRLLEDWGSGNSSITLTLNTSLVNLFSSARATNQFQNPGVYYETPSRQFNLDPNFLSSWKLPPGTPTVAPALPTITAQPVSQRIIPGQPVTFSVSTSGAMPFTYQWTFTDVNSNVFQLSGATNSSFTLPSAGSNNVGRYSVTVANPFGFVTSTNATLNLAFPPVITQQPLNYQAEPPGGQALFFVAATGATPMSYTWMFNGSPVASGAYVFIDVTANSGGAYTVVCSNMDGMATSTVANLAVTTGPDFRWLFNPPQPGSSGWSTVDSVVHDSSGNYAAGRFSGATLDLGGLVLTNSNWSPGSSANFVCGYHAPALAAWGAIIGTNSGVGAPLHLVSFEGAGLFLAGRFSGTLAFAHSHATSVTPADQFIIQFNDADGPNNGSILKTIPAYDPNDTTGAFGFCWDPIGRNIFISGRDGGTVDFGSGIVLTNSSAYIASLSYFNGGLWASEAVASDALAPGTNGDVFVTGAPGILAHYDNQGNPVWSRSFPVGQAIAVDAQENIFTTGYGAGTFDAFTITNSGGNPDCFTAKCDSSGQIEWLRQLGSVEQQSGTAIGLDSFNNIYVTSASMTGQPEPALTFGTNAMTNVFTFALKYDPAGNPLRAQPIQSTNACAITSLAVENSSFFNSTLSLLGGNFSGSAQFGSLALVSTNACDSSCPEQMFFTQFFDPVTQSAISISAQPTNQLTVAGGGATFSVAASSSFPLSYQWFYDQTNALSGATNASLSLSDIQPSDLGSYSVVITNDYGSLSSASATLAYAVAPTISAPPSDLLLPAGQNAAFNITATGSAPLAYQWQFNGANLDGATKSALTLTNIFAAEAGEYTIIVSNMAGSTNASAALTIALPPSFDPPPANLTVLVGQNASFSITASGTAPLAYQWEFNGTNLDGATDSTLTLTNISLDEAGVYLVTITNVAGATSNSATLSVYATAAATLAPLPSLGGDQFQFDVSGVPGFDYVIEASTNFIDWEPLVTNTAPFTFTDDEITNYPARYYRSVYQP